MSTPNDHAAEHTKREQETKAEAESVLNHLASMPGLGHGAVTREVLRAMLLATDGEMLLGGGVYSITVKHLGAGIYSVSTKAKPVTVARKVRS